MQERDLRGKDQTHRAQQPPEPREPEPDRHREDRDEGLDDVDLRCYRELLPRPEHRDQEALVPLQQREAGDGGEAPCPFACQSVGRHERSPQPGPDEQPQSISHARDGIRRVRHVGHQAGLGLASRRAEDRDLLHRAQTDAQARPVRVVEVDPQARVDPEPRRVEAPADCQRRDRAQHAFDLPGEDDHQAVARARRPSERDVSATAAATGTAGVTVATARPRRIASARRPGRRRPRSARLRARRSLRTDTTRPCRSRTGCS